MCVATHITIGKVKKCQNLLFLKMELFNHKNPKVKILSEQQ